MPDSIFDMQQTLFTSNLPVPTPRDRGQDNSSRFDQALDTAQRQTRDGQRAHDSQPAQAADNTKPDDTDQTDDADSATNDQVTLSKEGSETATSAEVLTTEKPVSIEAEIVEKTTEPTAAEIATAVVAPINPVKPVIKEVPPELPEQSEQHEGLELNDAVQFGVQRGREKATGKEKAVAVAAATKAQPLANEEVAVAPTEATAVVPDPNTAIVATELHSIKIAVNKNERVTNKPEQTKTNNAAQSKQTAANDTKLETGEYAEGAFSIDKTSAVTPSAPAPKRRIDAARDELPEVHENAAKLVAANVINATAAAIATPETAAETATETTKTPKLSGVCPSPTETPAAANHVRGPQIPNSFANHLEAAAAERKSNDPLNGVDRTRFVQRVARAFQRAGETEGEIRLRLSPPELGAVKLEVSLRDGAMIARMETETTTARNLLMDNLPQLKERLAEQNIRIETFEVEVRDHSNHSSADDAKEQLRQQSEQQRNRLRGERATTPVVAQPIVRTLPAARQSSQLNVVI